MGQFIVPQVRGYGIVMSSLMLNHSKKVSKTVDLTNRRVYVLKNRAACEIGLKVLCVALKAELDLNVQRES